MAREINSEIASNSQFELLILQHVLCNGVVIFVGNHCRRSTPPEHAIMMLSLPSSLCSRRGAMLGILMQNNF